MFALGAVDDKTEVLSLGGTVSSIWCSKPNSENNKSGSLTV